MSISDAEFLPAQVSEDYNLAVSAFDNEGRHDTVPTECQVRLYFKVALMHVKQKKFNEYHSLVMDIFLSKLYSIN
jgi:hypothetical protein